MFVLRFGRHKAHRIAVKRSGLRSLPRQASVEAPKIAIELSGNAWFTAIHF